MGTADLQDLETIEILFTTCDEIGALEDCRSLKRLSLLDNGIKCISGLEPVSFTLQSLSLCDQEISTMENLNLPNLRDLFLQRNKINKIENLHFCPRLRKLWLCQNKITEITGLHSNPELEELWLQANNISKLSGLDQCINLKVLHLSGNSVTEYVELRRLTSLSQLREVSLQDIHFGRCKIVDDDGYRDFMICYLKQIQTLDGVAITQERDQQAQDRRYQEVKQFNDVLAVVESEYQRDLQNISARQQNSTSQTVLLENEMMSALKELETLVMDGRNLITEQLAYQEKSLNSNIQSFENNLDLITAQATASMEKLSAQTIADMDYSEAQFCLLERLAISEAEVMEILCNLGNTHHRNGTSAGGWDDEDGQRTRSDSKGYSSMDAKTVDSKVDEELCVAHQVVSESTPDFQMIASTIQIKNKQSPQSDSKPHRPSSAGSVKKQTTSMKSPKPVPANSIKEYTHVLRLFRLQYFIPILSEGKEDTGMKVPQSIARKILSSFAASHENQRLVRRVYTVLGSGCGQCPLDAALSLHWSSDRFGASHANGKRRDVSDRRNEREGGIIGDSESLLFFSDPTTAIALLGRESFINFEAVEVVSGQDGKRRSRENEEDNEQDIVQVIKKLSDKNQLPKLLAAQQTRFVLLLSANMGVGDSGIPLLPQDDAKAIKVPSSAAGRLSLVSDLRKLQRAACLCLDFSAEESSMKITEIDRNIGNNVVYVIPPPPSSPVGVAAADKSKGADASVIKPEFLAICLCYEGAEPLPGLESGVRSMEENLEMTLLRESSVQSYDDGEDDRKCTTVLTSYEEKVAQQVRYLSEQLELGVDSATATLLRRADEEVAERERAIKNLKGDVEKERKLQENILRDLKLNATTQETEKAKGIGNKNR